jgi:hypothetical protein
LLFSVFFEERPFATGEKYHSRSSYKKAVLNLERHGSPPALGDMSGVRRGREGIGVEKHRFRYRLLASSASDVGSQSLLPATAAHIALDFAIRKAQQSETPHLR